MVKTTKTHSRVIKEATWLMLGLLIPLFAGCDIMGSTGSTGGGGGGTTDGTDDGDNDQQTQDTISLVTDRVISGADQLTILYAVPTTATGVRPFYLPISSDPATPSNRTYVTTSTLAPGEGQFTLAAQNIPLGEFFVGVEYTSAEGASKYVLGTGVLRVQGPPSPQFVVPEEDVTRTAGQEGQTIDIRADVGDTEDVVAWRLFYISQTTAPDLEQLSAAQVAELGNLLRTGQGNVVSYTWDPQNVPAGVYLLGLSATDTGQSVADTAAAGNASKIVTIYSSFTVTIQAAQQQIQEPTITVSQPANNVSLFQTGTVSIAFEAQVFEDADETITAFYDTDLDYDNGVTEIVTGLTAEDTTTSWTVENITPGLYYVGVAVDDGVNPVVEAYAPGSVQLSNEANLSVTEPAESLEIRPSGSVTISWTTNVSSSIAQTEVFAMADRDGDGEGEEPKIIIRALSGDETTTETWVPTGQVGRYVIKVRLVFNDPTASPNELLSQAPGSVRITTAPKIIWVGSFTNTAEEEMSPGAIFEGVQPEDNLGSAFSPVGDLDGDGVDEILMAARYGKPFFANPSGIGEGEAYLIYGRSERYRGRWNVNSVGIESLRGVIFTGIRLPEGDTETDGLADLSRYPDVDDDGRDEMIFGFPHANSRGHNVSPFQDGTLDPDEDLFESLCTLERHEQFLRGGVVIVSSKNSIFRDPTSETPVIYLDLVGQDFLNTRPAPERDETWFSDRLNKDSTPVPCEGFCNDPKTDGYYDTVHGTSMGFNNALADGYIKAYIYQGCGAGGFSLVCGVQYCSPAGRYVTVPASPLLSSGAGLSGFYCDAFG